MREALEEDRYIIEDEEWVQYFPDMEFYTDADKASFAHFARLAVDPDDVVYGEFYCYMAYYEH